MKPLTFLAALALAAAPALALGAEVGCDGMFGPDTTLADIQQAFGKANVVSGDVDGPEGTTMKATTVYPNDPDKMFRAYWYDEDNLARLSSVTIAKADTGPLGVKLGMGIKDVQKINGKPFTLSGFDWDYGGAANFEGGELSDLADGCFLSVTFAPSKSAPNQKVSDAIEGDKTIRSDLKAVLTVAPTITDLSLGWPDPNASDEGDDSSDSTDQGD
jgi:hypothetical protein